MRLNTFSIVAYDPAEQAFGAGVASKFLAAGALVNWVQAGVGAIATQSYVKVSYGPDGLALLAGGKTARETLDKLLANDDGREQRQVGIVDIHGGTAAHTGTGCNAWAGHQPREGFSVQGNILTGADVLDAMVAAYTSARGELADRLVAALRAGDEAGGDKRGKQAAAVYVSRPNGGYGGDNDLYLDLRVDDHTAPIPELARLVEMHHLYFGKPRPEDLMPITDDLARELQRMMQTQGYYTGEASGAWDDASKAAFWTLIGTENLEERWSLDQQPDALDRVALDYLRQRFGKD
jgi:uncharacterized Ntn-hydrolase superfamily protein